MYISLKLKVPKLSYFVEVVHLEGKISFEIIFSLVKMIECQSSVSLSPMQLNKFRIGRKDRF